MYNVHEGSIFKPFENSQQLVLQSFVFRPFEIPGAGTLARMYPGLMRLRE